MKPILYSKNAFDASIETVFSFSWNGNQAFKNKIVIRDNSTNIVAYEAIQETFQLKHIVAANSLSNGKTYNAEVYVIDSSGTIGSASDKVIFKCFTSPVWSFSNLIPNQIIRNSSYQIQLIYSQIEGELLNSYQVSLYNSSQSLLHQSGILYNSENLQYSVSNLSDNTQYYIRATGRTVNGMELDTGFIPVSVEYTTPALYSLVQLENLPRDGQIKISYNVQLVTGKCNIDEPVYIDDTKVDLTANGVYVKFDEGFLIQGDGIFQIVAQDFNDYSVIYEWSNDIDKLELKYMRGEFASQTVEKAYFILRAYNQLNNYVIYSNYIDIPSPTQQVHVWIKRIDNTYDLKCEIL